MEDLEQEFIRMAQSVGPDGFHPVFRDQLERWAKSVVELKKGLRASGHNQQAAEFVRLLRHAVIMTQLFSSHSEQADAAWIAILKYLEQTDVHPN